MTYAELNKALSPHRSRSLSCKIRDTAPRVVQVAKEFARFPSERNADAFVDALTIISNSLSALNRNGVWRPDTKQVEPPLPIVNAVSAFAAISKDPSDSNLQKLVEAAIEIERLIMDEVPEPASRGAKLW